ncbi:MAG: PDZ domain-containing protein [Candidatus Cloacimonadales bacterium]|jgi:S1-C subfamily serine protease|nr:PDZ domain-containing protein [Candidatus Cloacimonadales bacterium]
MLKQILIFLALAISSVLTAQNIYIGVYVREPDLPTLLKFNLKGGVIIDSVMKDSPASKAGLKKNQIIWKIDNHVLTNEEDFRQKLKEYNENDKILFTVKDNYKTMLFTVEAESRNTLLQDLYIYNFIQNPWLFIGFDVQPLNQKLANHFKQKNGLVIVDIREYSLAQSNGFKVKDIITSVNNVLVHTEEELSKQLAVGLTKQPILVEIIRDSKPIVIELNLTNKRVVDFQEIPDAVYIIGPDIFDNELYIYSQSKINSLLNKSQSEIEQEIQRLEQEIQGLRKRIKNNR